MWLHKGPKLLKKHKNSIRKKIICHQWQVYLELDGSSRKRKILQLYRRKTEIIEALMSCYVL